MSSTSMTLLRKCSWSNFMVASLTRCSCFLKSGRPYLLAYIGVMGQQDGVEYALHALDELVHKRGRQDVSLVLMGDGDHAATLRMLARELELDSYVNFTGWTESKDIVRYLTVADVGLSPDPENGLNEFSTMIKTMEYMA